MSKPDGWLRRLPVGDVISKQRHSSGPEWYPLYAIDDETREALNECLILLRNRSATKFGELMDKRRIAVLERLTGEGE